MRTGRRLREPAARSFLICRITGRTSGKGENCGLVELLRLDDQGPFLGTSGQVTLRGYDNLTGIGVPRWRRFIAALRAVEDPRSRS